MLGAIAIMPAAPVLVPELAGAAAAELADLRAAVIAAAETLPPHWIAVGSGPADAVFGPDSIATFAGFGADVPVRLSPEATTPALLPLCALLAGWVRGQAQPDARVQVRVYADPERALGQGERLRAEIGRAAEPVGVLVVADGANTLGTAAPGGWHPEDVEVQRGLDDALAGGDAGALAQLPAQILGRAAFAVLAGLAARGGCAPASARELYRGAPYGVGYFAGVWQP